MDLIVFNPEGSEVGYASLFSLDVDVGNENDFEIEVNKDDIVSIGCMIAEHGSEYGGILEKIVTNTGSTRIIYGGRTFRGILQKKIIRPANEGVDDYRIVSGNVGTIISTFLSEFGLTGLYTVESTTQTVTSFKFDRYCTFLDGIVKMLLSINQKMILKFNETDSKIHISIESINDYSDEIELSDDYKIKIKFTKDSGTVNHMICLGKGDLHERAVADLYVDESGNISTTQTFTGTDEIVETYESTSDDTVEALIESGTKKLQELEKQKVEFNVSDMDIELYDIVGAREYSTGEFFTASVTQKIVRATDKQTKIEYKVGE